MSKSEQFICKLTGKKGKPLKSHIIPHSFYRNIMYSDQNNTMKLVSNSANTYPQRSPIGVYDNEMVTAEGEAYSRHPNASRIVRQGS